MPETLEYEVFQFIDWLSYLPCKGLHEAFVEVGAAVSSEDSLVTVRGLSLQRAKEIAELYQADYLGPVFSASKPARQIKNITPVKLPAPNIK